MQKSVYFPQNGPQLMSGKITYKVKQYAHKRSDGTSALYLQIFINGERVRVPLSISVPVQYFDPVKQRVKPGYCFAKDCNLLIEKKLSDINTIEVNYRLQGKHLNYAEFFDNLEKPTSRIDFIQFWTNEMERQKEILKTGTYRQQMTQLSKLKKFKNPLYFYEIDETLIADLKVFCKKKMKNCDNTVSSMIKSFKKYLHMANKRGISSPLQYDDIKNKSFKGNRTFLEPEEIKALDEFYHSSFIKENFKNILSRFLFSCFTGLRISDISKLDPENFIGDFLVFTSEKTGKFQRIPLNESAKRYINPTTIFDGNYTNQTINEELKKIALLLGIRKHITYHVSRHTFATNFIICGGRVEQLQKLLGHSKIEDTMIYVHIADQITNRQINSMDDILKKTT